METLRAAVKQRLSAAAEDIFSLFERTIAEFEAEMIRQLKPELNAPGPGLFVVAPLLSGVREEQDGPEHHLIKEEEEEVWTNQEAAAVCDVTAVTVKIEEEEEEDENPNSSHPHGQSHSRENREEPARTSAPLILHHRAPDPHVCSDWTMHAGNESHGHGSKLYRCLECGNEFSQSSNLKTHMKIHTGEKAFCCSLCNKTFVQKIHLLQHMSTHTGEKMFSCGVCHKRFTLHYQLRKHLRLCAGPSSSSHFHTQEGPGGVVIDEGRGRKKQVICPECGDAFGSKDSLRRHFRTHTGEKPFGCPICGRHFRDRGNMGKHMVIHTGEKRFGCDVCGRRFTWKVQLKKHKCDSGSGAQ
ncbi:zinc finger protein 436-like [Solea solea]|uniref:zinc finger protein 436-like n=1 Tax=Solea solea TaxID=90069 RepID=UPI002729655A|nr:zinc finger protein 436-like [Solea solea]